MVDTSTRSVFCPFFIHDTIFQPRNKQIVPRKGKHVLPFGSLSFPPLKSGLGTDLAKADERIGLQVRVFHDKTTPIFQTVTDQILACVLKEKLLPEAVDAQEPIPYPSRNQTSKATLLTSLYSGYCQKMHNNREEHQHVGDI